MQSLLALGHLNIFLVIVPQGRHSKAVMGLAKWVGGFGAGKQGQVDLALSGSAFFCPATFPLSTALSKFERSTQQELKNTSHRDVISYLPIK